MLAQLAGKEKTVKRLGIWTVLAVFLPLALAPPAQATHVQCGDVITQDTTLDSDVVCPDTYTDAGLYLGAGTLRLAGHTVRAGANGGTIGIQSAYPTAGVQIRKGNVEGFDWGVSLQAVDSVVGDLTITARTGGINLGGNDPAGTAPCEPRYRGANCVFRNTVDISGGGAESFGIRIVAGVFQAGEAHVWGNTVRGVAQTGIANEGDRSRTVLNTVESCIPGTSVDTPGSTGIQVGGYSTQAVISINTVKPCLNATGIYAAANPGSVGNARLRRDLVTGNGNGMVVGDDSAIVANNITNDNSGSGIVVSGGVFQHSLLESNTANNNAGYGIYAPGVQDGGGNTATGNAGGNCVGVAC